MCRHSEPRNAGARGALKTDLAWQLIGSDLIAHPLNIQAAKLVRKFGVDPTLAKVIAELAFAAGEVTHDR